MGPLNWSPSLFKCMHEHILLFARLSTCRGSTPITITKEISSFSAQTTHASHPLLHNCWCCERIAWMHACKQVVVVVLPPFAFQNKTPCICPDSPMLLTCFSLSAGSRLMHRFRVSMIRPVCCSLACVALER